MATLIAELLRTTIFASSKFVKIASLIFLSLSLLFLAKLLSDSPFNPDPSAVTRPDSPPITVIPATPPITAGRTAVVNMTAVTHPAPPPIAVRPPPPPLTAERLGIVNSDGLMTDNFTVGPLDPSLLGTEIDEEREVEQSVVRVKVGKFGKCKESMREIIPCLDNAEAVSRLNSSERGEKYERHCPEREKRLNCLVPSPDGYKPKIPWPKSRDEVWYNNVPHTRLVDDKGGQNWISRKNDKFVFPGGGTQFIHGANQYLDQISKMVPDIAFGQHTRVVLDVGCGVASFGAFLLDRNVTTLSIAPKDMHENQIQFALERGVPAMTAVFGTRRLLYPSQAFDLIHCSRCRVNWTRDDGLLLLEVNRMLRAGGYFVWAAQPVYKHEDNLKQQWVEMEDLTKRMCWELLKKEGYIAIWQKPLNNSCYANQEPVAKAPLCEISDDPDNVWYVDLKACITPLPDSGYGSNITAWPARLHDPPDRLLTIKMDAYMSRKEIFKAESKFWNEIVGGYVSAFRWKEMNFRNVMDMRAGHGGFAAAMHDYGIDCWVMNVIPVSGFNTLPIIYDRGLIGVMHDWCEPFDTYPRTYDLLNAGGLFSVERKRCNVSTIMLEIDRILRPDGRVSIRDSITVIDELKGIAEAMGWVTFLFDTIEGPHGNWKVLLCEKRL